MKIFFMAFNHLIRFHCHFGIEMGRPGENSKRKQKNPNFLVKNNIKLKTFVFEMKFVAGNT